MASATPSAPPSSPTSGTPLRVAALGFWHVHAADYASSAVAHPGTELVAVWDDDAERGRAGAARFDVPFEADLDALLARDDVDAVTVTTSTDVHHDVIAHAARAGKHVFTEKLLAPTVAECEDLVAACDAGGLALVVSLPRLYHGYTAAIRGGRGRRRPGAPHLRAGAPVPRGRRHPLAAGPVLRPGALHRRRAHRPRLPPGVPDPAAAGRPPVDGLGGLQRGHRARRRGQRRGHRPLHDGEPGRDRRHRGELLRAHPVHDRRVRHRGHASATPTPGTASPPPAAPSGPSGRTASSTCRCPRTARTRSPSGSSTRAAAPAPTTTSPAPSSSPGSWWRPTPPRRSTSTTSSTTTQTQQ